MLFSVISVVSRERSERAREKAVKSRKAVSRGEHRGRGESLENRKGLITWERFKAFLLESEANG
jgi:hypothetical protein